ncbi:hypothetical protein VM1G_03493 [Cytospora mali]|uniref:Cyanovirin-N domain-containing protein n=1 Tax=Cytospora mali TaxID=578113 RepID=A0A194VV44_CYTMA|nr:hypothetical protein VM1G_03493 [Valsa mali]
MIQQLSLLATVLLLSNALAAPGAELRNREDAVIQSRADESVDGSLWCGNFASGSKHQAPGLISDLRTGGKIADKTWDVLAGTCHRVHCWDTTGIYVCNDASRDVTVRGTDVGDAAHPIFNSCCRTDYTNNKYNAGISGQKFIRNGTVDFNVVLGYGDCQQASDVRPYDAGGQGVNGKCVGGDLNPYWEGN